MRLVPDLGPKQQERRLDIGASGRMEGAVLFFGEDLGDEGLEGGEGKSLQPGVSHNK